MTSLSILTPHGLLLFIGAELIFSLTPGPTVMLISAYGFKGGFRDALAAIAGTQTGNTLWYVICVTGLGALVTASPLLFQAIKFAGAAYLVWLGAQALWNSLRAGEEAHDGSPSDDPESRVGCPRGPTARGADADPPGRHRRGP